MKAIEEEWKAYRDTRGRPTEQTEECHASFLAGAMTALMLMRIAGDLEDSEAMALITALEAEVTEYVAAFRLEMEESFPDRRGMIDGLHPSGRCSCSGEGRCPWCITTCEHGKRTRSGELCLPCEAAR